MPDFVGEIQLRGECIEEEAWELQRFLEERGHAVRFYNADAPLVRWDSRLSSELASSKQIWFSKQLLRDVLSLSAKVKVRGNAPAEVKQSETLTSRVERLVADPQLTKTQISNVISALKDAKADLYFFETGNVYADS